MRIVGTRDGKVYRTMTGANPMTDVTSASFIGVTDLTVNVSNLSVAINQAGDEKEDIVIDTMNVENAELITGKLTVSNAAELGTRDVLVITD